MNNPTGYLTDEIKLAFPDATDDDKVAAAGLVAIALWKSADDERRKSAIECAKEGFVLWKMCGVK